MAREPDGGGAADLEALAASELRALLQGVPVGSHFEVSPSEKLCFTLELFLPHLLCRRYPEWTGESFDGFFTARARKTGPNAAELVGMCIVISDQTVTPFLIELTLCSEADAVASFRVCVGESGGGRLGISGPACNSPNASLLLGALVDRLEEVVWSYTVASDGDSNGAKLRS